VAERRYGQYCGVTRAVELLGERWAVLIVRDLLVGPRRYTDLRRGLPRIPTNILASRLKELQEGGVVRRVPLLSCGLVYELTPYGRALEPILLALGRWGFQTMGEPQEGDVVTPDSLTMALRTAFRPEHAVDADYELHVGDVALRTLVHDGGLRVVPLSRAQDAGEPDVVIVAGPGIRRLIGGEVTPAEALARGLLTVTGGDERLLETFATTFRIDPVTGTDEPF